MALRESSRASATVRSYIAITKPRIILLLLTTTVPAMVVAEGGWPSTALVIATLVGGAASAAGGERGQLLVRPRHRRAHAADAIAPARAGREVPPLNAFLFGIALGVGSFAFLWATTNLLAGVLAWAAFLFYVFIYTVWLKRRSSQNIVIGGAAGAFPPMVGWAAGDGGAGLGAGDHVRHHLLLDAAALLGAGPPHRPRLPRGERAHAVRWRRASVVTRRQILAYSVPAPAAHAVAAADGRGRLAVRGGRGRGRAGDSSRLAYGLWRWPERVPSMRLYTYSLAYLAAIFIVMAVDVALLR